MASLVAFDERPHALTERPADAALLPPARAAGSCGQPRADGTAGLVRWQSRPFGGAGQRAGDGQRGRSPAATSWPRLKAARLRVSLRVPGRAAATILVSSRSAAIAYAVPRTLPRGTGKLAAADGLSVSKSAIHAGSGTGARSSQAV